MHKKTKKKPFVSLIRDFIANFALIRHTTHTYCTACAFLLVLVVTYILSACSPSHKDEVDRLNDLSYTYHYRSLDSVRAMAERAMSLSEDYGDGYAEACNNMAFAAMAKMRMKEAKRWLAQVEQHTDNQIELLVADVQYMRICQRGGHNKDFYTYREAATHRLRRIGEEASNLPPRDQARIAYARSEFDIVAATYFYYVSLDEPMQRALADLNPDELEQDTAQYLNYLYNFGSGGALTQGTPREIAQTEFDFLVRCYMLASAGDTFPYWQAQALQALSEHLQQSAMRNFLVKNNQPAIQYLNIDQKAPELLAGNFAQRALSLFTDYGDVYQRAGSYRTLAECYGAIGDHRSAIDCLNRALTEDKAIQAAPDLVASIREQLSIAYSAIDDKPRSDYNRNLYLDLQEQSRQDRQLEARAAQLDKNALQLNTMIIAVLAMIALVVVLLFVFDRMRRRKDRENPTQKLLEPLNEWKEKNIRRINDLDARKEEVDEAIQMARLHLLDNRKRHLEQRAKVALVNGITPFIDRMINEVNRLAGGKDSEAVRRERYQYISELTDKINQYNDILTQWIQMRQGTLNLRIESFPLQPLFDIVSKAKTNYQMAGIQLLVEPTDCVVKADRTLTLFMINTIADNARKFTPQGGTVTVSAHRREDCVEVAVTDNGEGMDEDTLSHVFDRTYTGGHGFGLLNCKGIIEKYKKLSKIFHVCDICVESRRGRGSTFCFRLPLGVQRLVAIALLLAGMLTAGTQSAAAARSGYLVRAAEFADSTYFSNINADYRRTLRFADSARHYLNLHYLSLCPQGKDLMERAPRDGRAAELKWLHDSLPTSYDVILDIRNESAVAALALHEWSLYHCNNKVYTQLFRERSADMTLPDYVRTMQVSENSKTVAVILLVLLLLQLPVAYYLLYFRHVLRRRFAIEKVNDINKVLLGDATDEEKLSMISDLWDSHGGPRNINRQLDELVVQIEEALRHGVETRRNEAENIELAQDELHRVEYENARLHVANSVMDNCLSTLKHETMYYPSRIRQLIDSRSGDIASLQELVDYYKQLYTMLSAQTTEQAEAGVRLDRDKVDHLFYLLRHLGGAAKGMTRKTANQNAAYTVYLVPMPRLRLTAQQCAQLFTPLTTDLQFLLCRQVVREIGEATNLRGCGIAASFTEGECVQVEVTLPKDIDNKYKIEI